MRFRLLVLALLVCAFSLTAATAASAAPAWSPEFQLSTGDGDLFQQHVVTDAAGHTTVIWNENGVLRARTRAAGGQFGAPVDIAVGDDVDRFDAASDAAGNITVGYITTGNDVIVKRAPVGTTSWPAGQTYTAIDPGLISAATNPAGTAIVAWTEDNDNSIYGVRKDPSDGAFSAADLAQTPSNGIDELDTAVSSDGIGFLLHTRDGSVFAIWSATSDWDEFSDNQLSGSGVAADGTIVANGTGDVAAYWDEDDGSHSGVRSSIFSGGTFGSSNEVSDSSGPDAFLPSAAIDDAGNLTLGYFVNNGFGAGVEARGGNVKTSSYGPIRTLSSGGGFPPFMATSRANDGTGLIAIGSLNIDSMFDFDVRVASQTGSSFGSFKNIGSMKNLFCSCAGGIALAADGTGGATASWATDDGSRTFLDASILADSGSAPPPAATIPQIVSAKLGVTTLRAASSGATISKSKAPKGTTLTVNASEAGTLGIEVQKRTTGRKASRDSKCSANAKKGKGCTIWKSVATTTRVAKKGLNKYKFSGRVSGEKLKPGQYRLVLTLKNPAGRTSAPKTRTFKIVR